MGHTLDQLPKTWSAGVKMQRRVFLLATAAFVLCGGSGLLLGSEEKPPRPNFVLFVTDDQGSDSLGCYGNPVIKTPHFDQLAAEGVRFDHCFSSASSCSPNRSVILSGLHHHSNGMYGLQQYGFSSFPP